MKFKSFAFMAVMVGFVGCLQQEEVKGKIFERRETNEGELMLLYEYTIHGKKNIDSVVIKNVIVESDSITLIADPAAPEKWIPSLER